MNTAIPFHLFTTFALCANMRLMMHDDHEKNCRGNRSNRKAAALEIPARSRDLDPHANAELPAAPTTGDEIPFEDREFVSELSEDLRQVYFEERAYQQTVEHVGQLIHDVPLVREIMDAFYSTALPASIGERFDVRLPRHLQLVSMDVVNLVTYHTMAALLKLDHRISGVQAELPLIDRVHCLAATFRSDG